MVPYTNRVWPRLTEFRPPLCQAEADSVTSMHLPHIPTLLRQNSGNLFGRSYTNVWKAVVCVANIQVKSGAEIDLCKTDVVPGLFRETSALLFLPFVVICIIKPKRRTRHFEGYILLTCKHLREMSRANISIAFWSQEFDVPSPQALLDTH